VKRYRGGSISGLPEFMTTPVGVPDPGDRDRLRRRSAAEGAHAVEPDRDVNGRLSGMQEWMTRASCRGGNASAFFPSDGSGVETAQHVCVGCPVRVDCLEYALTNRLDYGVWGGTSERERQRILRQRRQPVGVLPT
jgi:WhiB family transcriptional regulator, redox-sensing transcriptional regulator